VNPYGVKGFFDEYGRALVTFALEEDKLALHVHKEKLKLMYPLYC